MTGVSGVAGGLASIAIPRPPGSSGAMEEDIHDPAFVAALFDRCSGPYRRWSQVASFGMVALWRTAVVRRLVGARQMGRLDHGRLGAQPAAAPHVVDLMAGTGEVWRHLDRWFPGARITAIDLSPGMHARAVERLHALRSDRITHRTADALATPLPDRTADLVVSAFGLKTLSPAQQAQLAGEIARLLRPGGAFALIEASDPRGWALRPLYRFYLDRILPLIERLFLHGAQDFAMIGTYTQVFGSCAGFARALRDAGLIVSEQSHFFGCATSVAGIRPIAQDDAAP